MPTTRPLRKPLAATAAAARPGRPEHRRRRQRRPALRRPRRNAARTTRTTTRPSTRRPHVRCTRARPPTRSSGRGASTRGWPRWRGCPTSAPARTRRPCWTRSSSAPKATWFGHWQSDHDIRDRVEKYIELTTGGDPTALVQMAGVPDAAWHEACGRLPSPAEQASYRPGSTRSRTPSVTPRRRSSCSPTARSRCACRAGSGCRPT